MTYSRDQYIDLLFKCVTWFAEMWNLDITCSHSNKKKVDPMPDKNIYWLLCQDDFFLREQTVILFIYMEKWDYKRHTQSPNLKWDFEHNIPTVNKRLRTYRDYMRTPWDHLTMMLGSAEQEVNDETVDAVYIVNRLTSIVDKFSPEGTQALATDFTIDVPEL